jgi:23S rRNA (uracil1939-C5)-methyltransferase
MTLQRNQVIEITIDRLAHGGAGVGRCDGMAVFVHGSAPGDHLRARVTKRKAQHAEARIEAILAPSPLRQESPCPLFGECGGCRWLHIPHAVQVEAKRRIVEETFAHIGKIPHPPIEPIRPSPDEFRYRNKMDLAFGRDESGETVLGFHRAGQFDQIIDVPVCLLQPESFDRMVAVFRDHARREKLTPYDPRTHEGFLRSVILREGRRTGETLAILITAEGELPRRERLVEALREACPGLKGFLWGINSGVADVSRIERLAWLWGTDVIHEKLGDMTFAISSLSFFQTNTPGTELLYGVVADALDLTGEEVLLDAFCGTGSIGIFCAPRCRRVYGVELVLQAVADARRNAAANGLTNCTFLAGDVRETLALVRHVAGQAINRIVVDPPRGGMHQKALAQLIDLGAPLFVYVSCNPSTLARDLQDLDAAGYAIDRVVPLDLFPHTYHVETVVKLRRA